jgi:chaperonin GroEL|tara:strand:- start:359 stop:1906 length:1548 start_codon:yes stop_codon:yes gene_type:complete
MSKAVKSTLGPSGQTVLIESPNHTHGITVTKDGVTVAKAVDLIDPVENLAVRMMKEASDRTASEAGDGTTTAIVLTEALVCSFYDNIDRHGSTNTTEALRHLGKYTQDIIKHLEGISEPLTDKRLLDVATISSNNDTAVGEIIAKVYKAVGKDGIVTVENSQSSETTFETTHGIKIDKGYTAPLFINDHSRDECILDDCNIMVSDAEVSSVLQIEKILNHIIPTGKKLLIIAPVSQQVTNTLAANVMKNGLKVCIISPPNFGYKQHELMQDIAAAVGATYFSEKTGDDLSLMEPTDLGIVSKAVIGRESTILLQSSDNASEELSKRISQLRVAVKKEKKKVEKEFIRSRIATLTGGIGVIHVGGQTDLEQKELFDRVDDAVCAVRSALEEGILPGAGMALYNSIEACLSEDSDIEPKEMARQVLSQSLVAPIEQILINAGRCFDDVYYRDWHAGDKAHPKEGYDVKNSKYGNLIDMGVIDPLKVTKVALQNAVSVATTILSTNAIITMARSLEKE